MNFKMWEDNLQDMYVRVEDPIFFILPNFIKNVCVLTSLKNTLMVWVYSNFDYLVFFAFVHAFTQREKRELILNITYHEGVHCSLFTIEMKKESGETEKFITGVWGRILVIRNIQILS